jgi:hypothetical protein
VPALRFCILLVDDDSTATLLLHKLLVRESTDTAGMLPREPGFVPIVVVMADGTKPLELETTSLDQ